MSFFIYVHIFSVILNSSFRAYYRDTTGLINLHIMVVCNPVAEVDHCELIYYTRNTHYNADLIIGEFNIKINQTRVSSDLQYYNICIVS